MDGEMEVDSPDKRGTKRPVDVTESTGPVQPKRIKVGKMYIAWWLWPFNISCIKNANMQLYLGSGSRCRQQNCRR